MSTITESIFYTMTNQDDLSTCSQISVADGKLTEAVILLRARGEQLHTISKVNLWGLGISDASILCKMPNLRIVSMSTNLLSALDPFSQCYQLQELYLRGNLIADIHQVAHLKFLPKLQKLWLENNPCTISTTVSPSSSSSLPSSGPVEVCIAEPKDTYRYSVIRNLSQLTHLDLKPVTLDEMNKATVHGILLTAPPPTLPDLPCMESDSIGNESANKVEKHQDKQNQNDSCDDGCVAMDVVEGSSVILPKQPDQEAIEPQDQSVLIDTDGCHVEKRPLNNLSETPAPFDIHAATLVETNKIRHECGLEPLKKIKISPPVRNLQPPTASHERLVRNAVFRLLRTLSAPSLELVIHAAERQLYRLERKRNAVGQEPSQTALDEWTENSNYDYTNYLDNTL